MIKKKDKYSVAVAGATGAVGRKMLQILEERNFPVGVLKLLASVRSAGKDLLFQGKNVVVQELHLPVDRQVVFRIRSQDVLHSMYMPHFRAQMNAVPGMINQFAFTPNVTTKEMRLKKEVVDKVKKINNIRFEKSQELAAKGEFPLDPYEFDFLLLCNKVCGASHYTMQMKIVVETQEEFEDWFDEQVTFKEFIK